MDATDFRAPSPSTKSYNQMLVRPPAPLRPIDDAHKLLPITALVVAAVLALFLLNVLGSLRRRSSHKLLHTVVLGAYTLSYTLVSYTLGRMQDSAYDAEFPVWAVCLLMLLGGTDNLMACNLHDVESWKSFHVKHLFKGGLVTYIVVVYGPAVPEYQKPLWGMLLVNVLQSCVRIKSMRMASKSNLLSKNVKKIVEYMKHEDQLPTGERLEPKTMEGYRYVVAGEHKMKIYVKRRTQGSSCPGSCPGFRPRDALSSLTWLKKLSGSAHRGGFVEMEDPDFTTVEQIWRCTGRLLRSDSERGLRLKDVCLSMALSKMLNRRFAGCELHEAGLPKTHNFVFGGLLATGDKPYERAFRVIEVELGFVYDLYYTRYPYLYRKVRYFALCLPITMFILCSWLTYQLFRKHKEPNNSDNTPLSTTLVLMAVVTFLEVFQLYLHMASGWFKVALIRSYVTKCALARQDSGCFPRTIINLLLRLKGLRPWEDKLGQYSLLQDYNATRCISNCIHYLTLCLVDKAKKGRKRGKLVKLSTQVKKVVIDSLIGSNGHLTNGARALQNNSELLPWASKFGTVTETILVWHIATTICKHQHDDALAKDDKQIAALSVKDSSVVDTASSLSQYCAYLVAFAPDLLPGHSFDSTSILDECIQDARNSSDLQSAKTMEEKCEILKKMSNTNKDDDAPLVVQGALLASKLENIEDSALQWKVLSDFWAEMMLYIAPCEDAQARAHLEALARGGEFITHLWALLTHAGMLRRPPTGSEAI